MVFSASVDGAIVGLRSADQVDAIIDALRLELTDEDLGEIEGGDPAGIAHRS